MTRPASLLDGLPPKPTLDDMAEARLDWLILFLESLDERAPERFDMKWLFSGADDKETNTISSLAGPGRGVPEMETLNCGTSACMCGWIGALWGGRNFDEAGCLVGLDHEESRETFAPDDDCGLHATARQAAAMLRLFRETGRVDWAAVMEGAAG